MAYMGIQSDTIQWLNNQIVEIERWRADMAEAVSDGSMQFVDRLDAHRDWLVGALADLSHQGTISD